MTMSARTTSRRQSASIGAAVLGVLLLAGAALGTGIARTAVAVSDGLTWLGDDQRGEVVQVNPASGRPETRLAVAGGDARLDIIQRDGMLVVLDRRTGQITVIDLATLLASGRRQAPAGTASKVLLAEGRLFIVDRAGGTIAHVDPVTLADVGEPWAAGGPLADAAADEDGLLWAVDAGGVLHSLEWSDAQTRFVERGSRAVPGAGPRTVLVPHRQGVTLLGLEGGVVLQDGTGSDHRATTAPQAGDVLAAQTSPHDLVPAAVPASGIVVILVGDRVLTVDVGALGCPRPGQPAVFHDRVYVPCLGSGKVIVLNRDGRRGGGDVHTGAGDPRLVFDDDRLFIQTPGAETGVVVDPDGDTRAVRVRDPELPVTDPERDPPPTVPSPPKPDPDEPTRTRPNQPPPRQPSGPPSVDAPRPGSPTTTPSVSGVAAAPGQPAGITVSLANRTDTQVTLRIGWSAPAEDGIAGYTITATAAGDSATKQSAGTSDELTLDCKALCAAGGPIEIQVAAYTGSAVGTPGVTTWNLPARSAPPTTTAAPPPRSTTTTPPPPPPTTTQPPPPPTTTTTTTQAPPPASVPTAGATVITGVSGVNYQRTVAMAPPADWANHDGTCEVVNRTYGYTTPIACSATSAVISIEEGSNSIVVRAHARDGSRSVDSAARAVFKRIDEPTCRPGTRICERPRVATAPAEETAGTGVMVAAGIGLLITSALLRVRRRGEHG
ncbi:hypothetical protein [Actinokineospora sp. UTMC 2448]|uniref:hypothetical protein n=1 Tax=Actinokineospora sp. UTMC 2448 TaxID=2268449 RepID=UPI00216470B0|nr:hypothetical protein [Actinokineospora sp. UTMC 2448]UVS77768.1 hypothetical protein Actkin_01489 [Actinokineospora sp. UTMC 2448]